MRTSLCSAVVAAALLPLSSALAIVVDTAPAASVTYNVTSAGETVTIANGTPVSSGGANCPSGCLTTRITSSNGAFEPIEFANKTSVTINAAGGNDAVTLNMPTPATGLQNLTVDGGGQVDGLNGTGDVMNVGVLSLSGTVSLKGFFFINDNNGATLNITANQLALRLIKPATFGNRADGSANQPAGAAGEGAPTPTDVGSGDPLETDANTIAFSGVTTGGATAGSFAVTNSGNTTVGTVDGITTSRGGGISLTVNGGSLTVTHSISTGSLDLTTTDASSAGQNITVNSPAVLSASGGDVIIRAGDNFTLASGASMSAAQGFCVVDVDFADADVATAATVTLSGTLSGGLGSSFVNGGPQGDTFTINSGSASGRLQLNGAGGNDTYSFALGTVTSGTGIDVVETAGNGTDTVNLTGTAAAETFTTGAAAGAAPAGSVAITRTSGSGNSPTVTFDPTAVEAVNVNGAAAGESYVFNPANVAYTLAIADNGASGSDSITLNGSTGDDTLNASGTQITRGSEVANFSGIEAVTVNGNNGNDTFNITPSAAIPFAVAGGAPTPPSAPGDSLVVNVAGAFGGARTDTSSANGFAGSYTFSDRQPVTYSQIEARASTPACNLACPANITQAAPAGSCSRVVNFSQPGASDACGTITDSPPSGSTFPVGTTTVTRTSSLGTSCSFTVTVTDVTSPAITCPANVTVDAAPGENSAVVNYAAPTASDNCSVASVVSTPASGSSFPIGTTTVNATATDASGNTSGCTFNVTVNAAPTPTPSPTQTPSATPTPTATPTATATPSATASPSPTPATPTQLGNISTRLRVETGENVLIGGFIITGSDDKKFIARALGPSLGIAGALADPHLQIYNSEGGLVAENNNWQESPNAQAILDSTIPPSHPLEAAVVESLAPAAYTALVSGVNGGTGVGLVEVYDLDRGVDSKLGNISTRGFVQTGDDVMIGGTIILGDQPQKVIIRAIGPSLPVSGKLADPVLELVDSEGTILASNDDWRDAQESEVAATGIPPSDDRESAIVQTLTPGAYTAIVRGADGTTGVSLVEVYALE